MGTFGGNWCANGSVRESLLSLRSDLSLFVPSGPAGSEN